MAVDKLVDSTQLDADLTSVANAIRTKGGTSAQLAFPNGFISAIQNLGGDGLTNEVKQALLQIGQKVAYIDTEGQQYYNDLMAALYPLDSISAVFTQGSAVIYDTDSLDTLKQYLVVNANYSDGTSATVTDYTLSGTLAAGTSTITVSYGGKTTTFNVTVTSTYLFSVADRAMTVDDSIDTGLDLVSTDRDFSICLDVAITQFNGSPKIYYQFEGVSPWRGLMFGHGANNTFNVKYIGAYETISRAASSVTKAKAVISHTSGSDKALCYYRLNDETSTSSVTINNAFASIVPVRNLTIGKHAENNTWAGTINRFEVRSFALTSAQAASFINGE